MDRFAPPTDDLTTIYRNRFSGAEAYRTKVWKELCRYFQSEFILSDGCVLELGAGFGEFINNISAKTKLAIDLNPDARNHLSADVTFIHQDAATDWPIAEGSVDAVFTSNFLEHLPNKDSVERAIRSAYRALRPGGILIAMGPNIKFVNGQYWDFWDHHIPITELSLAELLRMTGFKLDRAIPRFLPFTMSGTKQYPVSFVRLYLALPVFWTLMGKQFLVTALK